MLDVRTYTRDGAVIAGFQFAADAQFLPYRDGRFLLVTRGVTGAFSATAIDPDLVGGTRLYGAAATVTEHMLGAIPLATSTFVITDEQFVNVGAGPQPRPGRPSSARPTATVPVGPPLRHRGAGRPGADRLGHQRRAPPGGAGHVGRAGGAHGQTGFLDSVWQLHGDRDPVGNRPAAVRRQPASA